MGSAGRLVDELGGELARDRTPAASAQELLGHLELRLQLGPVARAFDLQGKALFEVPLGEFTLSTAAGVRFSASERPHLAFVGSTDRDTNRYRLLIVDSMRRVVYDEVFDSYPRVLVARQADGSDTLFVSDARGLRQLRRR